METAIGILYRLKEKYGKNFERIRATHSPRKILVPTDFSKGSEYACFYAIYLAQKMNAEIKLLHVYEYPIPDMGFKESATYLKYMQHTL